MIPPEDREAVLVVDDDATARLVFERVVKLEGGVAVAASTLKQARELATGRPFTCALIDKNVGAENGLDFLDFLRAAQPDCAAIMVTAYGSIETAVEALRRGATDFVLKPFEPELLAHRLRVQFERRRLLREVARTQQHLIASDRLVALGTLCAGIVHEVNSPLSYVSSGLNYLEAELSTATPELKDVLKEMRTGLKLVADVVQNVKAFSRKDQEVLTPVSLVEALEAALRVGDSALKYRARVIREFGEAPLVDATPSRLAQVFLNLLVNAAQAMPEGRQSGSEIRVRLFTRPDGHAQVEIADTGAGMSAEVQARLFTPFFTTKPAGVGTGLGLWLCQSIVEKLQGRLELESAVGQGTTLRVILPPSGVPSAH